MNKKVFLLKTNIPEFSNDISEEIRLFYDAAQITEDVCAEHDAALEVTFSVDDRWHITARLSENAGETRLYTFHHEIVSGDDITVKRYRKRCVKTAVFRLLKDVCKDAFVPWGSLTGIRPTKLLRELEAEKGENTAKEMMLGFFEVEGKKYDIAKTIIDVQRPFIKSVREDDIDVYIGIPYCKTRCLYCSFASDVRTKKTDVSPYINALKKDIELGSRLVHDYGYKVRSTYIGGGTPTVLTEDELYDVLECAVKCYGKLGDEITVEAGRPDTVTRKKLEILRDFGIKRVSVNPQTMNEKTLELIGRSHTPEELEEAYYTARELGFDVNMDIITCLPGEGMAELENTLLGIEAMRPDNLTVHTLALKRSSRLKQVIGDEGIASMMPNAQLADAMVERGLETAKRLSMKPYYMYRQKYMRGNLENIGYALAGKECIYNIDMMEETVSIMAHGADSMSKRIFEGRSLRVERIPNPKDIATYIAKTDIVHAAKSELFKR